MLSRKKTRTELSKPGEVQGKYVKKETSPLLRSECGDGLEDKGEASGAGGGLLAVFWLRPWGVPLVGGGHTIV